MVDRTSGLPAYRQVADDLRARIASGELAPGDRLPSERQMVDTYGVSRPTVRDAVNLLRTEGLVIAEHGRGVFVRRATSVMRLARLSRSAREAGRGAFLGDAAAAGFTPSVEVQVTFEPADARMAELLGVAVGTELCVRDRVMDADGVTVQLAVSRFPRSVTKGTAMEQPDSGPGGTHSRLEEGGHQLDRFTEAVGARMPTPHESSVLQLSPGVPVLTVTRVAFTVDGRAVEVNDIVMSADRFSLAYEIPAT
ncbi:transcriptional regulator [Actinophytocola xinjiangensis]|uniref:Transcriptional regulator n=1 Tax=Actinophytocola xinjiangensis TaxID=485602 RepID=A0A7Z0WLL7_9PSEU|nr:GntR family transcriptional regulator [Actinophytocola xinjiangensis]OLF07761.1 transcriptional regulator [Actinophytocola xinjiangensis]